jgi:hypothetical protein
MRGFLGFQPFFLWYNERKYITFPGGSFFMEIILVKIESIEKCIRRMEEKLALEN